MAAADVDMAELFGTDDEDDEPKQQQQAGEGDEEDAQEREAQKSSVKQRRRGEPLHIELPVPAAKSGNAEMLMMRLSNIVSVKHQPFDPDTHETEGQVSLDDKGNEQFKALDLNVIRWRFGRNDLGEDTVESNARLVRFSDGSVQLEIGDEVLKVSEADMAADNDFLAVQHGGGVLEPRAHLRRKLVCRPSSLSSKSHRLLTSHVDKRHVKVTRVKRTVTRFDPERELEERRKEIEKEQREHQSLLRRQRKAEMGYAAPPRQRRSPQRGGRDREEMDADFLEREDDGREEPERKAGKKKKQRERYADSEDSAEDSDQSYSEDEDEEEERPRKKKKQKKQPQGQKVIESDSD